MRYDRPGSCEKSIWRTWTISPSPGTSLAALHPERAGARGVQELSVPGEPAVAGYDGLSRRCQGAAGVDRDRRPSGREGEDQGCDGRRAGRGRTRLSVTNACRSTTVPRASGSRRYHLSFHRATAGGRSRRLPRFEAHALDDGGDVAEPEVGNGEEHTPSPQSLSPACASPDSFPPLAKGGFGGVVVAPPVSNASQGGGDLVVASISSASQGGGWSLALPVVTLRREGVVSATS